MVVGTARGVGLLSVFTNISTEVGGECGYAILDARALSTYGSRRGHNLPDKFF